MSLQGSAQPQDCEERPFEEGERDMRTHWSRAGALACGDGTALGRPPCMRRSQDVVRALLLEA
eukprot:5416739-Prymnesium_polylepis.2